MQIPFFVIDPIFQYFKFMKLVLNWLFCFYTYIALIYTSPETSGIGT